MCVLTACPSALMTVVLWWVTVGQIMRRENSRQG